MFSSLPRSVVEQSWETWETKRMKKEDRDAPVPLPCPNLELDESSMSDVSAQDSPHQRRVKLERGQCAKVLQKKRRKAQMRLVNFKRGDITKPQVGEPLCLEMFMADLTAALPRPRGTGGRFASHTHTPA